MPVLSWINVPVFLLEVFKRAKQGKSELYWNELGEEKRKQLFDPNGG